MKADRDDKPNFEKNGFKIPEALRGLIENLPLLEGENPDHFLSLLQSVVEDQNPKGIIEWLNSVDMAMKYWEELRLRRASTALIQGGMFKAVNFFLNQISVPDPNPMNFLSPQVFNETLALKYFSKNPEEKKKVVAELAQHGITVSELQALAAELQAKPLQMFERMITARENGRRQLREEAAQHQRNRQKALDG